MRSNLSNALDFDESDIYKNERGVISDKQKLLLHKRVTQVTISISTITNGLLIGFSLLLVDGAYIELHKVIYIVLILISISLIYWLYARNQMSTSKLMQITGEIEKNKTMTGRSPVSYYTIKVTSSQLVKEFPVNSQIFNSFEDGKSYTIYYTSFWKILISATEI